MKHFEDEGDIKNNKMVTPQISYKLAPNHSFPQSEYNKVFETFIAQGYIICTLLTR